SECQIRELGLRKPLSTSGRTCVVEIPGGDRELSFGRLRFQPPSGAIQGPDRVMIDKTHIEHNESGLSPEADVGAQMDLRRFVPQCMARPRDARQISESNERESCNNVSGL